MTHVNKHSKKAKKKYIIAAASLVVLIVIFAGIVYALVMATPKYKNTVHKTLDGYSYVSFEGWQEANTGSNFLHTTQYNDYINDGAASKDLYAQHVVSVEQKAIAVSELTQANKAKLKAELSKTNSAFFESLKQSINGCSQLSNTLISVDEFPKANNVFIAADFSFMCQQPIGKTPIYAVGKVMFCNDGSAITAVIIATETVFGKNEALFRTVINSIQK